MRTPRLHSHAEGAPDAAPGPAPEGRARLPSSLLPGQPPGRPGTGQCTGCGDWFRVVGFGHVGRHNSTAKGHWSTCPGSNRPPATPVPCQRCGRTGQPLFSTDGLCGTCHTPTYGQERR